jgi:N4-gp56 family major capsid protein
MATTVTGTLTNTIDDYYVKSALATMEDNLVFKQFATMTPLPGGRGPTAYWNRWTDLGLGASLTEGTAPTAKAMSTTRTSAIVSQRGLVAATSDMFKEASAVNVTQGMVDRIAYSAASTVDTLLVMTMLQANVWNTQAGGSSTGTWVNISGFRPVTALNAAGLSCWLSGLSTFNGTRLLSGSTASNAVDGNAKTTALAQYIVMEMSGTGASPADLSTTLGANLGGKYPMKGKDVRAAVQKLRGQNIPAFDDGMYIAVVNSAVESELMADSEFQEAVKYVNPVRMYKAEINNLWGVRFLRSENIISHNISGVGGAAQVNFVPIFGRGCYGMTEMVGGLQVYRTPAGGVSDPLHQVFQIGAKISMGAALLNASAGVLVVCSTPRT